MSYIGIARLDVVICVEPPDSLVVKLFLVIHYKHLQDSKPCQYVVVDENLHIPLSYSSHRLCLYPFSKIVIGDYDKFVLAKQPG